MTRYMLDTNTVSHLVKGHPGVVQRVVNLPMADLCISAVTEGELLFGLAKRPEATRLHKVVHEFLLRVDSLPWDSTVAAHYGPLRAALTQQGRVLAPLDCMIACHAHSVGAVLVSSDRAFVQVAALQVQDWAAASH